jgi:lysyl-tRNA synthetase class 2
MQLSEQEIIRREKLQALRNLGINPYPAELFAVNDTSKTIKEMVEELTTSETEIYMRENL